MQAAIGEACAAIRAHLPRARWVRSENLHLTFAFLGEVEEAVLPRLSRNLREKLEQGRGFSGRFSGVGAFPPAGKVRVVWIGLEPEAKLEQLAALVRAALSAAEAPFDEKAFRAHVTLARCDPPWPVTARADLSRRFTPFTELFSRTDVPCERVTVFSSVLASGGPTYRPELEVELQGPPRHATTAGVV